MARTPSHPPTKGVQKRKPRPAPADTTSSKKRREPDPFVQDYVKKRGKVK